MMQRLNRKTNPRVIGGRVQKKHNHALTVTYWNTLQPIPVIDKERPGFGYRHYLRKKDVAAFLRLLPDWAELSQGLDAVLLAAGRSTGEGWYDVGIVGLCAWANDPWKVVTPEFYAEHELILTRLGVACEPQKEGYLCKFTAGAVRAYQLLHIFLHELGHHHDRMTTRRRCSSGRGESYAEYYAHRYEQEVWARYVETFALE